MLELMIVVAILGIVASVGVPQYVSALRIARVGKAKQELVTIAQAVDAFMGAHEGRLPLTLYQVGFGGRRDPWGLPYCYLNYADGTGDGLYWAIEAGLVDPSAVKASGAASAPSEPRRGGFDVFAGPASWPQEVVALPDNALRSPKEAEALAVAAAVTTTLVREVSRTEVEDLSANLLSAGSYTVFAGVPTEVTRRRDRYLFPLNTDYDLFSLGPNGQTTVSLGESLGQDDVIRANNGGFFGTASDY